MTAKPWLQKQSTLNASQTPDDIIAPSDSTMGGATGLPSLGNPGGVPDDITGAGAAGISSTGLGDTAATSSTLGGGLGGS
jgi:hypothetical protein